ncbi:hypothetical protein EJB05_47168, partial [Eragrostis curvula]
MSAKERSRELVRQGRPPGRRLPSASPVREHGTPPPGSRGRARGTQVAVRAKAKLKQGTRGERDDLQVARAQPQIPWRGSLKHVPRGAQAAATEVEEGAIEEFYGELWYIPLSPPRSSNSPRVREPVKARDGGRLVWIRRELWESKKFGAEDCHPVGWGDQWDKEPQKLNFAEEVWGEGKKKTFLQAVKEAMANRGRGRGQRPQSPEEEWGEWGGPGWYGQQSYHGMAPPPMGMGQGFGFYPPPMGPPYPPQAWSGEVEPVEELVDTWVQVKGIPPKWCDWESIQQVSSSLGLLEDMDWNSLFSSMFETVRFQVAVRDPRKIPRQRLIEMKKKLYLITFNVEGAVQGEDPDDYDGNDLIGDDSGLGGSENDNGMDTDKDQSSSKAEDKDKTPQGEKESKNNIGAKTVSMWGQLMKEIQEEVRAAEVTSGIKCTNLLREMELAESEDEEEMEISVLADQINNSNLEDEEIEVLPKDWTYDAEDNRPEKDMMQEGAEKQGSASKEGSKAEEQGKTDLQDKKDQAEAKKIQGKQKWGPVMVTRKSKRNQDDGRTAIEKAQEAKKRHNLETNQGVNLGDYDDECSQSVKILQQLTKHREWTLR